MHKKLRFLLLQIRNPGDPMRVHEVQCFARTLPCDPSQIRVFDLLSGAPGGRPLGQADMILLGGSGHYSAAGEGEWLERALDALRDVYAVAKPTFASCWGFQALARALGGRVVHDASRAELGTMRFHLTPAGREDPIFAPLGEGFRGQAGHEDHVDQLAPGAKLLAFSEHVQNQAYCFPDRPIYCTQFHPELGRKDLESRIRAYPEYVRHITGMSLEEFCHGCENTPEAEALLPRFVQHVFG